MIDRFSVLLAALLFPVVATASLAAEVQSVSVLETTGEKLVIPRSVVKLTPVYRGQLLRDMQVKVAEQQRERQKFNACLGESDGYQCWRMYGDEVSKPKVQVPTALQWLQIDPLYVVLQYRLVLVDLNRQSKLGDEGLVVCLNPRVPEGYWPVINRFKPILKKVPGADGSKSPIETLKARACAAFVDFSAKSRTGG